MVSRTGADVVVRLELPEQRRSLAVPADRERQPAGRRRQVVHLPPLAQPGVRHDRAQRQPVVELVDEVGAHGEEQRGALAAGRGRRVESSGSRGGLAPAGRGSTRRAPARRPPPVARPRRRAGRRWRAGRRAEPCVVGVGRPSLEARHQRTRPSTGLQRASDARRHRSARCAPARSPSAPELDRAGAAEPRLARGSPSGRAHERPSGPSPSSSRKRVLAAIASRSRRSGTSMRAPPRLCVAHPDATCCGRRELGGVDARARRRRARRRRAAWRCGRAGTAARLARRPSATRHRRGAHRLGVARQHDLAGVARVGRGRQREAPGRASQVHRRLAVHRERPSPASDSRSTRPSPSCGCTASASATGTLLSFWISTTSRSSPRGPRAP